MRKWAVKIQSWLIAEADLELAAQSIVAGAFGFSGQKCSACSRAVIVEDVYDQVLNRVVELTNQLTVGDPTEQANIHGSS